MFSEKSIGTITLLSREIECVQQHIDKVNRKKTEAITELEDRKRRLRVASQSTAAQIELQIREITREHATILAQLREIQEDAIKDKKSIDMLDETIAIMDKEISRIQDEHNRAVLQLEEKKDMLRKKLKSITDIDVMINSLTNKIIDTDEEFQANIEQKEQVRNELLSRKDLTEEEMTIQLAEIEKEILETQQKHLESVEFYNKQREDMELESAAVVKNLETQLDGIIIENPAKFLDEIKALEATKLFASPSKLDALNNTINTMRLKLEEDTIRRNMTSKERLEAVLEKRGLRLTPSGRILTGSGHLLTRDEATVTGLLDGLDRELLEARGLTLTASGKILTQAGELMTRQQAEELGLLDVVNVDEFFEPESVRSDLSSRGSGIVSEDIQYLKKNLGLVLTLALAEITAKQPRDPIHYLGHWLFKYRYNQEVEQYKKQEVDELTTMREQLAKERWMTFLEAEARTAVLEMVARAEETADENVERELQRIANENMEHEEENEDLTEEAKDTLGEYNGPAVNQRGSNLNRL